MKTARTIAITIVCTLVVSVLFLASPWGRVAVMFGDALLNRYDMVKIVPSPNGAFEAYVVEEPSIDPPNQSLHVQHSDKSRFMHIAKLAEDVDAIEDILWSPDSRLVVFRSRYYLTATRISDWTTIRIYLGGEWVRSRPSQFSTFSTSSPRGVDAIAFLEDGAFSYRLSGETEPHLVRFPS